MEIVPGALPRPGRVPEQRLLSPKIRRRRRRSYETVSGNLPTLLGFFIPRLLIGEGASSGVAPASSHLDGVGQGQAARAWCEGGLWPLSFASSDLWKLLGKIRLQELVSSNSENISCVAFLKHKNSKK
jgi:hypothetical protein